MNVVRIYKPYGDGDYIRDETRLAEFTIKNRIDELRHKLDKEKPDVFVSHKSDDKDEAEKVAHTIAKCGLTAYLDIWDPDVNGDGPELVDYINSVIGCCNSLIAVVSHKTVESWWVPLEIGIAITKDLYLGTYLHLGFGETTRGLPSYLWRWPVLERVSDLENWCKKRKVTDQPKRFYESLKLEHPNMFKQYPWC